MRRWSGGGQKGAKASGPAAKRASADNGNSAKKQKKGGRQQRGGSKPNAKKNHHDDEASYWDQLGAEFEISDEEGMRDEWSSDSDEDELPHEDEIKSGNRDGAEEGEDTAAAIVRRWKQAQQQQKQERETSENEGTSAGAKRKREQDAVEDGAQDAEQGGDEGDDEAYIAHDEEEEEEEANVEEERDAGGGGDDDDAEEEAPRVRKGPGSVSFANVLGQLLVPSSAGGANAENGDDDDDADNDNEGDDKTANKTTEDPILMGFKRRKPSKKLETERRRKREARDLALKKKLLKARDHHIPTVLNEPSEVRLRKLATKGVVQLFNAVRKQQKMVNQDIAELEKKNPEKAERMSKNKFLELLQKTGTTKKNAAATGGGIDVKKETKKESKEDEDDDDDEEEEMQIKEEPAGKTDKPQWDVLSDDYMMGASLKDMPDDNDEGDE